MDLRPTMQLKLPCIMRLGLYLYRKPPTYFSNEAKRLRIRDYLFSETLSEKEIEESKDMVSNWQPGQCPTP
jgi:hypothetical protein